jgi:hypothetical protein
MNDTTYPATVSRITGHQSSLQLLGRKNAGMTQTAVVTTKMPVRKIYLMAFAIFSFFLFVPSEMPAVDILSLVFTV